MGYRLFLNTVFKQFMEWYMLAFHCNLYGHIWNEVAICQRNEEGKWHGNRRIDSQSIFIDDKG